MPVEQIIQTDKQTAGPDAPATQVFGFAPTIFVGLFENNELEKIVLIIFLI